MYSKNYFQFQNSLDVRRRRKKKKTWIINAVLSGWKRRIKVAKMNCNLQLENI